MSGNLACSIAKGSIKVSSEKYCYKHTAISVRTNCALSSSWSEAAKGVLASKGSP